MSTLKLHITTKDAKATVRKYTVLAPANYPASFLFNSTGFDAGGKPNPNGTYFGCFIDNPEDEECILVTPYDTEAIELFYELTNAPNFGGIREQVELRSGDYIISVDRKVAKTK